MLQGKGIFIWEVQNCEGGDPARIVQVAQQAGLRHVAVKVADGSDRFPAQLGRYGAKAAVYERMMVEAVAALKAAGIAAWGWQFVYGRSLADTSQRIARAEADVAVARVQELGLGGFIIDFEQSGSRWTYYGDGQDARTYMERLREGLPGVPLAACSHRFPHLQSALPWEEFLGRCDLAMPQVYWVQGEPRWNLQRSWEEYRSRWPHLPFIPVGAAYGETYDTFWSASPQEVTAFLQQARAMDLPAVSFWHWRGARCDPGNPLWPGTELWDAVAAFNWPGDQRPDPPPERTMWVASNIGLKLRRLPSPNNAYWIDGIVVPWGSALTALGDPTARDTDGYRWQRVRLADGREGWVGYSYRDTLYLSLQPLQPDRTRDVWVSASSGLKFRSQPSTDNAYWIDQTVFPPGTRLLALGDPTPADANTYRWQRVRLADGREGWVAYSIEEFVYLSDEPLQTRFPKPPAGSPRKPVTVTASLGLKFRRETLLDDTYWIDGILFPPGSALVAVGSPTAQDKLGYRWHYVRSPQGREGWVIYSIDDEVYLEGQQQPSKRVETVWTKSPLTVRAGAAAGERAVWAVADGTPLKVLEDGLGAAAKIGVDGQWIRVRTPSLKEGFVSALYVSADGAADNRQPAGQARPGESPHIFGFHDPFDRGVFAGSGKTGWVLVTEGIGAEPAHAGGNRHTYYDWSRAGFGVLARLNHGYDSGGTLPTPDRYGQFAATCARWVQHSIDPADPLHGCHVWIIGNEMNNPREWPGNHGGHGGQPITPADYARCFNQVYAAIHAVQPGAIVCPGAIDPYNAMAGDCKEWFNQMMAQIDALDGVVLHTYTHGASPALITNREPFGNDPLTWQYYNFYAYRTFMDLIPGKWKGVPVFITETDQNEPWADTNSGWVQRAYEEIDRWNRTPHQQQIRCLLMYRWPNADQWGIQSKHGVIEDFKAALQQDRRWRQ